MIVCPICGDNLILTTKYQLDLNNDWDKWYDRNHGQLECNKLINEYHSNVSGHSITIEFDKGKISFIRLRNFVSNEQFIWKYYKKDNPQITCHITKIYSMNEFALNEKEAIKLHELQVFK